MQVFIQTGIIAGLSEKSILEMKFDSNWFFREGTSICLTMIMLTYTS